MNFILNIVLQTLLHISASYQGFSGMGIIQSDPFFRKMILKIGG